MIADAPADGGEGIVFFDHAQGIGVTPFTNEGDVTLRALTGGTRIAARGDTFFLDGKRRRDRLRIETIGGAAW